MKKWDEKTEREKKYIEVFLREKFEGNRKIQKKVIGKTR